jgi:1-acyl-sn-glycerol-3-phosphate acyltransferase
MLYMIARGLLRVYFSLFRGWVINGIENVPAKGSLIVVANHSSYWDPPIVGSVLPRRVYFMAKEELFRYPLFGNLLSLLGAFPVKRGAPDRTAIRAGLDNFARWDLFWVCFPKEPGVNRES